MTSHAVPSPEHSPYSRHVMAEAGQGIHRQAGSGAGVVLGHGRQSSMAQTHRQASIAVHHSQRQRQTGAMQSYPAARAHTTDPIGLAPGGAVPGSPAGAVRSQQPDLSQRVAAVSPTYAAAIMGSGPAGAPQTMDSIASPAAPASPRLAAAQPHTLPSAQEREPCQQLQAASKDSGRGKAFRKVMPVCY